MGGSKIVGRSRRRLRRIMHMSSSSSRVAEIASAVSRARASRLETSFLMWRRPGQEKGEKLPTLEAHISIVFHSFWLIFGRAIISRGELKACHAFLSDIASRTPTLKRR